MEEYRLHYDDEIDIYRKYHKRIGFIRIFLFILRFFRFSMMEMNIIWTIRYFWSLHNNPLHLFFFSLFVLRQFHYFCTLGTICTEEILMNTPVSFVKALKSEVALKVGAHVANTSNTCFSPSAG